MGTSGPKSSRTGSQFSFHRKPTPNFCSESVLPMTSEMTIAPRRLKTAKAKNRVRFRKIKSINALLRSIGGLGDFSTTTAGLRAIVGPLLSSTRLMDGNGGSTHEGKQGAAYDRPLQGALHCGCGSIDRLAGIVGHRFPR